MTEMPGEDSNQYRLWTWEFCMIAGVGNKNCSMIYKITNHWRKRVRVPTAWVKIDDWEKENLVLGEWQLIQFSFSFYCVEINRTLGSVWAREWFLKHWCKLMIVSVGPRAKTSKLPACIIFRLFSSDHERSVCINQADFLPSLDCIDQIFTPQQLLEHRRTFLKLSTFVFLDLTSAFDSVGREILSLSFAKPRSREIHFTYSSSPFTSSRNRVHHGKWYSFSLPAFTFSL